MNKDDFDRLEEALATIKSLKQKIHDEGDSRAAWGLHRIAEQATLVLQKELRDGSPAVLTAARRVFWWPAMISKKAYLDETAPLLSLLQASLGKDLPIDLERSWRPDDPATLRVLDLLCRVSVLWNTDSNVRIANRFEEALDLQTSIAGAFHPLAEPIRDLPPLHQGTLEQWRPTLKEFFDMTYDADVAGFQKDFAKYLDPEKGVRSSIWREVSRRLGHMVQAVPPDK